MEPKIEKTVKKTITSLLKRDIELLIILKNSVDEWYKNVGVQRFLRYDREPNEGTKDFLQEIIDEWDRE